MAPGPGIRLDIAVKNFPDAAMPLLEGLQLTIAPSSVVALVGTSSVGKSTILRLLAGIDRDFAGAISIDGAMAMPRQPPASSFRTSIRFPG
ncbi:MAG: ATP-binding cassette domain-containing protein [Candidatus Devosia symbiotica]|nr:ATP-binding cassette domain-containing protein [Candidatus Devosia symbiotica]